MDLKEYKKKYDLSSYGLAKRFGIPPTSVYKWIKGYAKPSPRYAVKLCKISQGEITLEDLGLI